MPTLNRDKKTITVYDLELSGEEIEKIITDWAKTNYTELEFGPAIEVEWDIYCTIIRGCILRQKFVTEEKS